MRRQRSRVWQTALALGAALLLFGPRAALASNWLGGFTPDTDYGYLGYHLCNVNGSTGSAFDQNRNHDLEGHVPTVAWYSCGTADYIEVQVMDDYYGESAQIGWWECHSAYDNCSFGHVHINLSDLPFSYMALVCQEVGHSVGLAHTGNPNSCMNNPVTYDRQHLSGHDKFTLDQHY